jgi:hypothetical protein
LYFDGPSHRLSISNVAVSGRSVTGSGGGIWASGDVSIVDSVFRQNSAGESGGGVMIASPDIRLPATAVIQNSTFSSNSALRGGAIAWDEWSTVVILNSAFLFNRVASTAIAPGEGAALFGAGPLVLAHSTVAMNLASANLRGVPNSIGGGIRVGHALLSNSIVAGNNGVEPDVSVMPGGRASASYSLIGSNVGSGLAEAPVSHPDAKGNLIGGPMGGLVNPLLIPQTVALRPNSPAVNSGDPHATPGSGGLSEFDIRGVPYARIYGGRIDIGAYELQPVGGALSGDFNGDGRVDGADFMAWQRGAVGAGNTPMGDATGNGVVDGNDLAVWTARFNRPPAAQSLAQAAGAPMLAASFDKPANALAVDAALLAEIEGERNVVVQPTRRPAYRPEAVERVQFDQDAVAERDDEEDQGTGAVSLEAIDAVFAGVWRGSTVHQST